MFLLFVAVLTVLAVVFPALRKLVVALLLILAAGFWLFGLTLGVPAFTFLGASFGAMTFAGVSAALFAAGTAFVLFPDEAAEVVTRVGEGLAVAAESIVQAASNVATGALSGFLSSPGGLLLAGFGIWWFFFRDKRRDDEQQAEQLDQSSSDSSTVETATPALTSTAPASTDTSLGRFALGA